MHFYKFILLNMFPADFYVIVKYIWIFLHIFIIEKGKSLYKTNIEIRHGPVCGLNLAT